VNFWGVTDDSHGCNVASLKGLQFDTSVTAVDFAPGFANDRYKTKFYYAIIFGGGWFYI